MNTNWDEIQNKYADIPGREGADLRRKYYQPFFLKFGDDVVIEEGCRFYKPEHIVLGDDCRINIGALIYGSGGVWLGSHTRVGPRVFIHSANHNINSEDELAFFERGYVYDPVFIGDNVLISANVSILPGSKIGNGTFVACGSVVSGKFYPDSSRLFGIPAINKYRNNTNKTPLIKNDCLEIIFLINSKAKDYHDAIAHLLSSLGLPQVGIRHDVNSIENHVKLIICVGNLDIPEEIARKYKIWYIVPGYIPLASNEQYSTINLPYYGESKVVNHVKLNTLPSYSSIKSSKERNKLIANQLMERLEKPTGYMNKSEIMDWLVFLKILKIGPSRKDRLLERILEAIWKRWPEDIQKPSFHSPPLDSDKLDRLLNKWFKLCSSSPTFKFPFWNYKSNLKLSILLNKNEDEYIKKILTYPSILIWESLSSHNVEQFANKSILLEKIVDKSDSFIRYISISIVAKYHGLNSLSKHIDEKLAGEEWWPEYSIFPKNKIGSESLCYSPLYLAWSILSFDSDIKVNLDEYFFDIYSKNHKIQWKGFKRNNNDLFVLDDDISLVDIYKKKISLSIIQNWIGVHTLSISDREIFKLTEDSYINKSYYIWIIWFSLFQYLFDELNISLIHLKPWPFPYRSALSIRYDVDRCISSETIHNIIKTQMSISCSPNGSWYFRKNDPYKKFHNDLLISYFQETGLHVESISEVMPSYGVTHHSAPTSEYWQGSSTISSLEKVGASYGEILSVNSDFPVLSWINEYADESAHAADENLIECGKLGRLILTPLHFPLEGGTNDRNLDHFDKLNNYFEERIAHGGHIIIGTHPDLNQSLLLELHGRKGLKNTWNIPIDTAIKRYVSIMSYGAIRCADTDAMGTYLVANSSISDLQLDVYKNGELIKNEHIHLVKDWPRFISFV